MSQKLRRDSPRKKSMPKSIYLAREKVKRSRLRSTSATYDEEEIRTEIQEATLVPEKAIEKETYIEFLRQTEPTDTKKGRPRSFALRPQVEEDEQLMDLSTALKTTDSLASNSSRRSYRLPRTVSSYLLDSSQQQTEASVTTTSSNPSVSSPLMTSPSVSSPSVSLPVRSASSSLPPTRIPSRPPTLVERDRQESDAALEFLRRAEFFAALNRVEKKSTRHLKFTQPQIQSRRATQEEEQDEKEETPAEAPVQSSPEKIEPPTVTPSAPSPPETPKIVKEAQEEPQEEDSMADEIALLEQFIMQVEGRF